MSLLLSLSAGPGAAPQPIAADPGWECLHDGSRVLIRPLQAQDRELETAFLLSLSPRTRRQRFLCDFRQPSRALIDQLMDVDHESRIALIAVADTGDGPVEVGVSRFSATDEPGVCECAVTVTDDWQHKGLGELLMRRLIDEARLHGFTRMISLDAASNHSMRILARRLGFERRLDPTDPSQAIHTLAL
ncbi:GNAT family N-acetyltransferase [Dyella sp. C9]|uniref:GNAT family N-acetyltransferase n=1 Tax=Dyella sp. C9 TaxID=2202154 RepID=UPI000DEF9906|nr:GNAT family N-acetyltransferase [Dyella sp. C9]